jgi:hypothetical protein
MGGPKNHQILLPVNQVDFRSSAVFGREHTLLDLK